MNAKQQTIIGYLKANKPQEVVTIFKNDDPAESILFRGTVTELVKYYQEK